MLVLTVLVPGCGPRAAPLVDTLGADAAAAHAPWASGSRLRAKVLDGGGGARTFETWRDTELGVDCRFATAEDGQLRCVPDSQDVSYLDPACTEPVMLETRDASNAIVDYAREQTIPAYCANTDSVVFNVWKRADVIPSPTMIYGLGYEGGCAGTTPTATLYSVSRVSPSVLEAGHSNLEKHDDRIAAVVITADDGAGLDPIRWTGCSAI